MNLRSLDLNLLVIFDAIYREGNVTRAATKVGLSQPATSGALARLRGHLDDELFLRGADGLRPTARATELASLLPGILTQLERALEPQVFDPASSKLILKIASLDYFLVVVAPELLRLLAKEAPGIRIHFTPVAGQPFGLLDSGEVDFAFSTLFDVDDRFGKKLLLKDTYSCLVRKGHPLLQKKMSQLSYAQSTHILVSPSGNARGFVDEELAKAGLTREIGLVANHFSVAPPIVANSDLVLTAPTLALKRLKTDDHELLECPVHAPAPYNCLELIWHKRLSQHPANVWLQSAIARAAKTAIS